MRRNAFWLLLVLFVSAAASAMAVRHAYNHPESLPGQLLCRLAGICTTGPSPVAGPMVSPTLINLDDAELPEPLIPMSPELEAACRWDLTELRAISALRSEPSPSVQTVSYSPGGVEDEFTYPRQEPPEESILANGERIKSYPTPLPEEAIEVLPPPAEANQAPSPEPTSEQTSRGSPMNLEVELCLAGLPSLATPQIGVQHVARQILQGCGKVQAVCFPEHKPGNSAPKTATACEENKACGPNHEVKCEAILRAVTRDTVSPEVKAVIFLISEPLVLPNPPTPVGPPMPFGVEHPFPIPIFSPISVLREAIEGSVKSESPCRSCPTCCSEAKSECGSCAEKCPMVRRVYPVADLLDPTEDNTPEHLIRIICRTVAPRTWEEFGGRGVVDFLPFGKVLIVYHTEAVQEEVAELLGELRAAMSGSETTPDDVRRARFDQVCPEKPTSSERRAKPEDCERCKRCPESDR